MRRILIGVLFCTMWSCPSGAKFSSLIRKPFTPYCLHGWCHWLQLDSVRFKPGQSGNPAGRPKGAKSRFTNDFWRDLHEVWSEHGKQAILDTLKARRRANCTP